MYTDSKFWADIRRRVLIFGESRRSVARQKNISRQTVRKILANDSPPTHFSTRSISPSARCTVWRDLAECIQQLSLADAAQLLHATHSISAERLEAQTLRNVMAERTPNFHQSVPHKEEWCSWLYLIERGEFPEPRVMSTETWSELKTRLRGNKCFERNIALALMPMTMDSPYVRSVFISTSAAHLFVDISCFRHKRPQMGHSVEDQ